MRYTYNHSTRKAEVGRSIVGSRTTWAIQRNTKAPNNKHLPGTPLTLVSHTEAQKQVIQWPVAAPFPSLGATLMPGINSIRSSHKLWSLCLPIGFLMSPNGLPCYHVQSSTFEPSLTFLLTPGNITLSSPTNQLNCMSITQGSQQISPFP